MKNLEWFAVQYNGLETNVEVTKCGRVRRIKKEWVNYTTSAKIGEVDFSKLKLNNDGYMQLGIQVKKLKPKTVQVQQLLAAAFLGYEFGMYPEFVVMHIDDNPLNNNLSNLKVDTQRENCSQLRTKKSGLPVGVHFYKQTKKYQSCIKINGKLKHLGYFKTIEEASQAYQNKLKEISIQQSF
jgi:hypothetical protein